MSDRPCRLTRRMGRLDRLEAEPGPDPGATAMMGREPVRSAIGKDVVLTVHGTGAGSSRASGDERWWQDEGSLDHDLREHTGGRCVLFPVPFRWSGRNSERDRKAAG